VISANLKRRHLNESQRAMIAANLANMRQGERTDLKPSANLQKVAQVAAAKRLNVSVRTVASAAKVRSVGTAELIAAVEQGRVAVSAAAKVATHDPDIQRSVIERVRDGSDPDIKRALHAAVRQKRDDAIKAQFETMGRQPVALLSADESAAYVVLDDNRPVRITRGSFGQINDSAAQGWKLAIGPNVDHETHQQRKQEVGRDVAVAKWRHERDDLINRAAGLETAVKKLKAKARKLRLQADRINQQIKRRVEQLLEREHGPAITDAEYLGFEADEASEAVATLPPDELVRRLIAIRVAQGMQWVPKEELADKPIRRVWLSYRFYDELIT
jgi:hypothetical protein